MFNATNYKSVFCVSLSRIQLVKIELLLKKLNNRNPEKKRWTRLAPVYYEDGTFLTCARDTRREHIAMCICVNWFWLNDGKRQFLTFLLSDKNFIC